MSVIDDVKARLDIVDVVSGYVPELKKMGRSWKARCPFHSERTPSFVVDPERQTWHCFGSCGTGGDMIEFVRRIENLEFREALARLAERAGVELRPPSAREREERDQHERLLAANEAAAIFFQSALSGPDGADARAYFASRGLDDATVKGWQLGYAPGGWSTLTDHLLARGFAEADIVDAGLALRGDRGLYDRFRDRVIYPTRDGRRRLIGFGARAIRAGDEPKYLNTPQTPLFDKSGNLYGLDRAAESIRRLDRAVVVEGYMDVIGLHQFGFDFAVASNGTSITEKQMTLLKRYTHNIVLALDADAAGSAATLRGVEVAAGVADRTTVAVVDWRGLVSYQEALEADIRVVTLPEGEDPDSLVRKDPEALQRLLDAALPVADHLFRAVERQIDPNDPRSRSRGVQALVPTVAVMTDPVIRSHYVAQMARLGQVDERTVLAMLAGARAGRDGGREPRDGWREAGPRPVATPREVQQAKKAPAAAPDGERQILELLLQRREARGAGIDLAPAIFEDGANRVLFETWLADADLLERVDALEPWIAERAREVAAVALPDYEPRHVPEMVIAMARELRLRRAQRVARLAATESSAAAAEARRAGQPVLEAANRGATAVIAGDPGDGDTDRDAGDDAERLGVDLVRSTVDNMRAAMRPDKRSGQRPHGADSTDGGIG